MKSSGKRSWFRFTGSFQGNAVEVRKIAVQHHPVAPGVNRQI